MSCECFQIGGRFIAEDPDCPAHGTQAQYDRAEDKRDRQLMIDLCFHARESGSINHMREALSTIQEFLELQNGD